MSGIRRFPVALGPLTRYSMVLLPGSIRIFNLLLRTEKGRPDLMRAWFQELRRRHVFRVAAAYVVVAWLIIQAASVMFPRLQLPPWTVRAVIAFTLLGFPLAMVFAWAFEVTPEGVRRTDEIDEAPETPFSPEPSSLAVLPFTTIEDDPDSESFAHGLHDDLLTQLSHIESLKIISRTSVESYRDSPDTLPEIARELGVAHIMEGGVHRAGDRIQVKAKLIDALSDEHLWAETYDRELSTETIFETQKGITRRIVESLNVELSPEDEASLDQRPTQDLQAYDFYTRARQCYARLTSDSLRQAVEYCDDAIERDPEFASAYALKGRSYCGRIYIGDLSGEKALPKARRNAERALSLNPDLAEARYTLAVVGVFEPDGRMALRQLQKAIETNPGFAEAWAVLGVVHVLVGGSPADMEPSMREAVELDPENVFVAHWMGVFQCALRNFQDATEWFQRALELEPLFYPAVFMLVYMKCHFGAGDEVRRIARLVRDRTSPSEQRQFGIRAHMALASVANNDEAAARDWVEKAEDEYEHPVSLALAWTGLGETDRAITCLESLQDSDWKIGEAVGVRFSPLFDPLRGIARFEAVLDSQRSAWGSLPERSGDGGERPRSEPGSTAGQNPEI